MSKKEKMEKEVKISKFEQKAIELETENENIEKQASRAYRSAVSKIETQIAQLNGKKVELEGKIDDAKDEVEREKFSMNFNLKSYDTEVSNLEELEDELKAIDATIENRKHLLESWK